MNRKKFVLKSIIFCISIFIVFIVSLSTVYSVVKTNFETDIKNISDAVVFKLQNPSVTTQDVIDNYKVYKDVQLSFFAENKTKPVYDTSSSPVSEDSFEIISNNKDKFYYGKSATYSYDMGYYVSYLDDYDLYLRVGKKEEVSLKILSNAMIYGSITFAALDIAFIFLIIIGYNKMVNNLKLQVRKLRNLTYTDKLVEYNDDISNLTNIVKDTRRKLQDELNINSISEQKMNFILDSINQGLLVLGGNEKIILINKKACEIFETHIEKGVIPDVKSLKNFADIEKNMYIVTQLGRSMTFNKDINGRIYECDINLIDYSWSTANEKNGASLLMFDITDQYNSQKMKNDFFANASHELKSPLTSILGYQQMIYEKIITSPEQLATANERCIKESLRMKKLLMDMLDISSLENNNLRPIEKINPQDFIDNILLTLEPQIKKKHINVFKSYDNFLFSMNLEDCDKLFRNLIDNAIKYNKDGGDIFITINSKDKTISIKDSGIGLKKEDQQRIFERFYRVDKARSVENGGTGLGLSIVKYICNYYEFQIKLNSTYNKGTEFKIIIK